MISPPSITESGVTESVLSRGGLSSCQTLKNYFFIGARANINVVICKFEESVSIYILYMGFTPPTRHLKFLNKSLKFHRIKTFNKDILNKINKSTPQFGHLYTLVWGVGGQKLTINFQ